jgi:hypothetical protein
VASSKFDVLRLKEACELLYLNREYLRAQRLAAETLSVSGPNALRGTDRRELDDLVRRCKLKLDCLPTEPQRDQDRA